MHSQGRRVVAALWSLQGIGLKTLQQLRQRCGDEVGDLLTKAPSDVRKLADFTSKARESLASMSSLAEVADALEERVRRLGYRIAFEGDDAYPPRLTETRHAPPVLFYSGPAAASRPRRRVALVGTRHPDSGYVRKAMALAQQVADAGIGVISGAADGIDHACHKGAIDGGGETWAFLGSAIEEVDRQQQPLLEDIKESGGTLFSEFPPGARPDRSTFPRRNRLISGAADAVVVIRAGTTSGALHTARYALDQGRSLLAMPGDFFNASAAGCNALIQSGDARVCLGPADIIHAVGLHDAIGKQLTLPEAPQGLSQLGQKVISALERTPLDFDAISARLPDVPTGQLSATLMELQLAGVLVQKPGSRYEKL